MFHRFTIVFCVLSVMWTSVGVASAAPYIFVGLPPTDSDTSSLGLAVDQVNGLPEVAGRTASSHPTWYNRGNAAIFNGAGAETSIGSDIAGATYSTTTAIDSKGDVAGVSYSSGTLYSAFYLPAGGTSATILPNLIGGTGTYAYSNAYGINSAGQIVGYSNATDGNFHAAVWTNTGGTWGVTDLGASGYASCADAINANGMVAGEWTATSGTAYEDAATWTYSGSAWVLHDLINRSLNAYATGSSYACAINDNGVAVGGGTLASFPSLYSYAWKFNGDGTATWLGSLTSPSGGTIVNEPFPMSQVAASDCALGINDSDVIVGQSSTAQNSGMTHAFIYGYNGNNTMQDMNTVFAGDIPAGWTLTSATGIDNNGDIVGVATNSTGFDEGFLLATALPGDANTDGKVDINDLTIVLSHYGQTGMAWSQGEFTGDGTVDLNDLTIVLAHYNDSLGSSAAAITPVPEPASLLLALAGALGLLAYARRKRK
jgi:probable HAF family extracellular repeat protein